MPNFWLGNTERNGSRTELVSVRPGCTFKRAASTRQKGSTTFGSAAWTPSTPDGEHSIRRPQQTSFSSTWPTGLRRHDDPRRQRDSQRGTNAATSSTAVVQQAVTFVVNGRMDLFQANRSTTAAPARALAPTQFNSSRHGPPHIAPGGTFLVSQWGGRGDRADRLHPDGGECDQLHGLATPDDGSRHVPGGDPHDPKVTNFFIGGETNNVMMVAPNGSRNV